MTARESPPHTTIYHLSAWIVGVGLFVGEGATAIPATEYFAIDVPTLLGGTNYTTAQIVRNVDGAYATELTVPGGGAIAALHRRADGTWLIVFDQPVTVGAVTFEPRDIATFDGVALTMFLPGAAAGIPSGAEIDALFLDAVGHPVLSFAAPTRLGPSDYGPSDLVRFDGAFSLYWDAQAAGVPPGSNLCGAATTASGTLVVSFDVPTRLGYVDYLPGQLVGWTGSAFVYYSSDLAWPISSQLRDFSFAPTAGAVPESGSTGVPLTIDTAPTGDLVLTWGQSCAASDSDFEIYEGALGGDFSSHVPRACSTAGATSRSLTPSVGSAYYLVVPRNGVSEGSYGLGSGNGERPRGPTACLPREIGVCI